MAQTFSSRSFAIQHAQDNEKQPEQQSTSIQHHLGRLRSRWGGTNMPRDAGLLGFVPDITTLRLQRPLYGPLRGEPVLRLKMADRTPATHLKARWEGVHC